MVGNDSRIMDTAQTPFHLQMLIYLSALAKLYEGKQIGSLYFYSMHRLWDCVVINGQFDGSGVHGLDFFT